MVNFENGVTVKCQYYFIVAFGNCLFDRSARTERTGFMAIQQVETAETVAEISTDFFTQVAGAQDHCFEPVFFEQPELVFQEWLSPYWGHGFWQIIHHGSQPGAEPYGQDNCGGRCHFFGKS